MRTVTVTAHFDGEYIKLDEPLGCKTNTKPTVTVLSTEDYERPYWRQLSVHGLAHAYSKNGKEYALLYSSSDG